MAYEASWIPGLITYVALNVAALPGGGHWAVALSAIAWPVIVYVLLSSYGLLIGVVPLGENVTTHPAGAAVEVAVAPAFGITSFSWSGPSVVSSLAAEPR